MGKPDVLMIWYTHAQRQFDDGHWDGDFFCEFKGSRSVSNSRAEGRISCRMPMPFHFGYVALGDEE